MLKKRKKEKKKCEPTKSSQSGTAGARLCILKHRQIVTLKMSVREKAEMQGEMGNIKPLQFLCYFSSLEGWLLPREVHIFSFRGSTVPVHANHSTAL